MHVEKWLETPIYQTLCHQILSLFWFLDFYRTHCLHKIVHMIFERWPIENLMSKHALNNGINTITLICCYRACFKSFFGKIPMYNFFIHYQEQHKIDSLRMFSKCCYKVIIIFMLITLKVYRYQLFQDCQFYRCVLLITKAWKICNMVLCASINAVGGH